MRKDYGAVRDYVERSGALGCRTLFDFKSTVHFGGNVMRQFHRIRSFAARGVLAAAVLSSLAGTAYARNWPGTVYALSNQVANNSVLIFSQGSNGSLTPTGSVLTGGAGTGPLAASGAPFLDPLGSQGSLVLRDGLLFAVNAGSNEVSMFRAEGTNVLLLDKVSSGGQTPVSIAVRGFRVYVLNQGSATAAPNITGFVIDPIGFRLLPSGTQLPLAGGVLANPAEIHFNGPGDVLIATEKGTNLIDTYRIDFFGNATSHQAFASAGSTPFGFAVTAGGIVVVSDAASGAASSYRIADDGELTTVSGLVSNSGQAAPCWLVTTPDGSFAFEANAGSSTISSFAVAADGTLNLVNGSAAAVAGGLLDMALSDDGRFLQARDGAGTIYVFAVGANGSLTTSASLPSGTLPAGSQGIAAR